jgi:hypothetical protein
VTGTDAVPAPDQPRRNSLLTRTTQVDHANIAPRVTAANRMFEDPSISCASGTRQTTADHAMAVQ